MKSTLIIPAAGLSTRYGGTRPKWLLTDPQGSLIIERVLEIIDSNKFSRIVIATLKEFQDKYFNVEVLENILTAHKNVEILLLDQRTQSQTETVKIAIEKAKIVGPIYIKDCDNYFATEHTPGRNEVAYLSYVKHNEDPRGKSFIQLDHFDKVKQIVEKKILSENFCVGGYAFQSAEIFMKYLSKANPHSDGECYVSNVLLEMLLSGEIIEGIEATQYVDLGTIEKYQEFKSQHKTIFMDFDGVLVQNSSKFDNPPWKLTPIKRNIEFLQAYVVRKKISLIITTARPRKEKNNIFNFLKSFGIETVDIITDLPHAQRIIVNDFSATNVFPTAQAINIKRDDDNLSEYFK